MSRFKLGPMFSALNCKARSDVFGVGLQRLGISLSMSHLIPMEWDARLLIL